MNFLKATKLNSNNLSNISVFDFHTETTVSLEELAVKTFEREQNKFSSIEINQQENVQNFREKLFELTQDEYTEEFLAPTNFAYQSILKFLDSLSKSFNKRLPVPSFIPDGEGGIRAEWEIQGRELRLVCPAKPDWKPYLYHEEGDSYDVEKDLKARTFIKWFSWLLNE